MGRVILDASAIIAALDDQDRHHNAAGRALADSAADELIASAVTYAEALVRPMRRDPAAVEIVETFFELAIDRVEPLTAAMARRGARLRADHRGLSLGDALVLATAEEVRADRILTADRRWRGVSDRIECLAGD